MGQGMFPPEIFWTSLTLSSCVNIMLFIPLVLSYSQHRFNSITNILIVLILSVMSLMSYTYTVKTANDKN